MPAFLPPWFTRFYLAILLSFTSGLLLGPIPTDIPQTFLRLLACGLLATALLDLLQRYHVHELYGVLLAAGSFGLGIMLLNAPEGATAELAYQLTGESLGRQMLNGLIALGIFLFAGREMSGVKVGLGTGAIFGAALLGGINAAQTGASLPEMLLMAGAGLVGVSLSFALARRYGTHNAEALLLTRPQGITLLLIGAGLMLLHLESLSVFAVGVMGALAAFILLILRFQRRRKALPLLAEALPLTTPTIIRLALLIVGIGFGLTAGYALAPHFKALELHAVLQAVYIAIGLSWLPAISFVMGIRGFQRQSRHWVN